MSDTDDQLDQITKLLHDRVKDELEEGEVISEWVTVVHIANLNDEFSNAYWLLSDRNNKPSHVIRGLLYEGLASPRLTPGDLR